ncbi:hypothetical protein Tco_1304644 [Tanacetum coccineum]
MTSLKSLDPDNPSKNHVRKFLRALPLKWRAKVYEMVLDNDGAGSKTTKEKVKSLALKAKVTREQTSDDSDSQGGSDEYIFWLGTSASSSARVISSEEKIDLVMEVIDLVKAAVIDLRTKVVKARSQKGLPTIAGLLQLRDRKPKENKDFFGGAWSDSVDGNEHQNDTTCLMAIDSQEVVSKPSS